MNLKIVLFLLTASFPIIDASINYFYDKSEVTTTLSKKQLNELNPPNILFIIADDMGKDATAGFSEGTIKPSTPNLNSIKDTGLKFNNFWTYPTCSPTRASIITGKYGYRTGIKWAGDVMDNSEKILQQFIKEQTNNTYATGLIGKWHLS